MAGVNPRIFRPIDPELPPIPGVDTPIEPDKTVPISGVQFGEIAGRAAASRKAADAPVPGWGQSLTAGIMESEVANAWRWMTMPEHAPEPNEPDAYTLIQQLPFVPTEDEQERLMQANSHGDRKWLAERMRESRENWQIAAANPSAMIVSQFVDPTTLLFASIPGVGTAGGAARAATLARTANAAIAGAAAGGVSYMADRVAPISTAEFALNVAANMLGGALITKGGKLAKRDPNYPEEDLRKSLEEFRKNFVGPAPFGVEELEQISTRKVVIPAKAAVTEPTEVPGVVREVSPAVPEQTVMQVDRTTIRFARENPVEVLNNGARHTPEQVAEAVDAVAPKMLGGGAAEKIMWNLSKEFRSLGPVGQEIADALVDNNLNLSKTSAESVKRAVRAALGQLQWAYEDAVRKEMAKRGVGALGMIFNRSKAIQVQNYLERSVKEELLRRDALTRQGKPLTFDGVHPAIKEIADKHAAVMERAITEAKARGVFGAEEVSVNPGYFSRRWSSAAFDDLKNTFTRMGLTADEAHKRVVQFVKRGVAKANPNMTDILAYDVAASIVDRTMRKGYLVDGPAGAAVDAGTIAQLRDRLKAIGVRSENIDKVIEVVEGKVDEAGKASFLKHRLDVDFSEALFIDGRQVRLSDMIDSNISTLMDSYLDRMSGRIALSQVGMKTSGDIAKKREALVQSLPEDKRQHAAWLFDNTVNKLMGNPVGAEMNQTLRNMQAVNRMVALGSSGLWQLTEYATIMQKYGLAKTLKYMLKEAPGFRHIMSDVVKNPAEARSLKNILEAASEQNFRLRPYIERFEDNFDIPNSATLSLAMQQGTQIVPYMNGMKYVHAHQARITANLIVDAIDRAAQGNAKYVDMLKRYGVESHIMDKLKTELRKHGHDVDKWDDDVWAATRPAFVKMMDEAVLHQRMGDMPSFAQFSEVGKFIFTFRSFILTAHNKLLAGTAAREGSGAVALMMLYQFPLSLMATQANSVIGGKGLLNEEDLVAKSFAQMGSVGLFGEIFAWLTGNKQEVGAPGLIAADRFIQFAGSAASATFGDGSLGQVVNDAKGIVPLLSILPTNKMWQFTED